MNQEKPLNINQMPDFDSDENSKPEVNQFAEFKPAIGFEQPFIAKKAQTSKFVTGHGRFQGKRKIE